MKFHEEDQIEYSTDTIHHESAGGFVFFESPKDHQLFVALLRKAEGGYVIPKGHIHKGEAPEKAAIREIKEELNLNADPEIISKIGTDSYTFKLDDSDAIHYKNVQLFVFQIPNKAEIYPQKNEGYEVAEWIPYEQALDQMTFDRENLLKAREHFYYDKPVKEYGDIRNIQSITFAIPTHNGAKTILKMANSLIQRLIEIPDNIRKEVIVCLDHCTDDTKNILSKAIDAFKNSHITLRIIDNDGPKGKSLALNKIFSESSGEIFCVIDDDVVLMKSCLKELVVGLVLDKKTRCIYSAWERLSFESRNTWKIFWHEILGVKFDLERIYNKPNERVRGSCMMIRKDNFVKFPPYSLPNEDEFIQCIYWPMNKEEKKSVIQFNSVSSPVEYFKRFLRIAYGSKLVKRQISEERYRQCVKGISRKIETKKLLTLPKRQAIAMLFYGIVRRVIGTLVTIRLWFPYNYDWFRITQN